MPPWVETPIGMDDAAEALGVSKRALIDWLKEMPYFEWRGRKKVFYREHITRLRREMHKCGSRSNGSKDGRKSTAPDLTESGSDALQKLKTLAAQKK